MKVLNNDQYKATCSCGAVVGYGRIELKWSTYINNDHQYAKMFYINCPICGDTIRHDSKEATT